MRSVATCYSEHAIKVSDSYCSGSSNLANYLTPKLNPCYSTPREVTCIYKTKLSNQNQVLMITLTWFSNLTAGIKVVGGGGGEKAISSETFKRLKKQKGNENFISSCGNHEVEVLWDFSNAKYEGGPEPVDGFYVMVLVDSELCLVLGHKDYIAKNNNSNINLITGFPNGKFSLVSRSERLISCNAFYSTKAQFCDEGIQHDIVRRLRWNFRGNQAIFLDGLLVDMMWDVHDWFFNSSSTSGCAVFMFRTRTGLNSRLWLEQTTVLEHKEEAAGHEFSLLICACKNPD
ncbi:uncharacterized protein LOC21396973 [Morus notabilis]|uniref:uncharacterized protein LOC21396973 n=1 Tax=Morus notabilis TaxID=981085 RepID=UPI000CECEE3F|nr:uncharacterized protein LOC21396973 [Morus notabilis]